MKAAMVFVAALILLCGGCASEQKELTEAEKNQIKGEVKAISDSVYARMQRLDFAGSLEYFWDSPEFVAYWPNASSSDFGEFRKFILMNKDSLASLWITKVRDDFPLVKRDLVLHVLTSKYGFVTKSGATVAYDPDAESHLFRRIDGRWKIAFLHESEKRVKQETKKQ